MSTIEWNKMPRTLIGFVSSNYVTIVPIVAAVVVGLLIIWLFKRCGRSGANVDERSKLSTESNVSEPARTTGQFGFSVKKYEQYQKTVEEYKTKHNVKFETKVKHIPQTMRCPFSGNPIVTSTDSNDTTVDDEEVDMPTLEELQTMKKKMFDRTIVTKGDSNKFMKSLIDPSGELFENEDMSHVTRHFDKANEYLEHFPSEFRKAKLRQTKESIEQKLTDDEKQTEEYVKKQQLEAIFKLMEEQQEKFGIDSLDDVRDQMRMYAI